MREKKVIEMGGGGRGGAAVQQLTRKAKERDTGSGGNREEETLDISAHYKSLLSTDRYEPTYVCVAYVYLAYSLNWCYFQTLPVLPDPPA